MIFGLKTDHVQAVRVSKPKLEFYSVEEPTLKDVYPILPSSEVKMPWAQSIKQQYISQRQFMSPDDFKVGSHMCSGITGLMKHGWVVTSWCDVIIETNGDGESYRFTVPPGMKELTGLAPVGGFKPDLFGNHTKLPPQTLKTILKFHTPWKFDITDGWGLMILPLQYNDENRFTAATGVLDPKISQEINPILFWHVMQGETFIKAGTPLCYIVPVRLESDNDFEFVMRDATEKDIKLLRTRALIRGSTWVLNKNMLVKAYKKVFGK
jgi:hypothetical protein